MARDHVGPRHRVLGLGNLPGPLIGDAQGGEAEGVFRLQFANFQGVPNRLVVPPQPGIDHGQGRMGQGIVGVLREQLVELGGGAFQVSGILELIGLGVKFFVGRHGGFSSWVKALQFTNFTRNGQSSRVWVCRFQIPGFKFQTPRFPTSNVSQIHHSFQVTCNL